LLQRSFATPTTPKKKKKEGHARCSKYLNGAGGSVSGGPQDVDSFGGVLEARTHGVAHQVLLQVHLGTRERTITTHAPSRV